jgi:hypothetical protein
LNMHPARKLVWFCSDNADRPGGWVVLDRTLAIVL